MRPMTGACIRNDLALLDERVQRGRIEDGNIKILARFDFPLQRGIDLEVDRDLVPARALELRAELAHRGTCAVAAQNFDVGG